MATQPTRAGGPLYRCAPCGGNGGKNVSKRQTTVEWINDLKAGKKVEVQTTTTVDVWEPCRKCGGTGVVR